MSRVMVLGMCPLPWEDETVLSGLGIRTWHFTSPLVAGGHEVFVVGCRTPGSYPGVKKLALRVKHDDVRYLSVAWGQFAKREYLERLYDKFQPDCVLGVNTFPASMGALMRRSAPLWADLNGWVMSEAQMKAVVHDDDEFLTYFWQQEQAVLKRADVFSVVSMPQKYALLGELATLGRLNRWTFNYKFVSHIPNSVSADEEPPPEGHRVLRDELVPEDAFVVLWVGGYNTWADVETLHAGLVAAMDREPRLWYVSLGGAIKGHDEKTFPRFMKLVETGPHRERFVFPGWVPTRDFPRYVAEADVGLNVDSRNYETMFGARNRLTGMMKSGLTIVTSLGSEISEDIEAERLGLTFPSGDPEQFAERLVTLASDPDLRNKLAERAHRFVLKFWTYERTTRAVQRWAADPWQAPDRKPGELLPEAMDLRGKKVVEVGFRQAVRRRFSKMLRGDYEKD